MGQSTLLRLIRHQQEEVRELLLGYVAGAVVVPENRSALFRVVTDRLFVSASHASWQTKTLAPIAGTTLVVGRAVRQREDVFWVLYRTTPGDILDYLFVSGDGVSWEPLAVAPSNPQALVTTLREMVAALPERTDTRPESLEDFARRIQRHLPDELGDTERTRQQYELWWGTLLPALVRVRNDWRQEESTGNQQVDFNVSFQGKIYRVHGQSRIVTSVPTAAYTVTSSDRRTGKLDTDTTRFLWFRWPSDANVERMLTGDRSQFSKLIHGSFGQPPFDEASLSGLSAEGVSVEAMEARVSLGRALVRLIYGGWPTDHQPRFSLNQLEHAVRARAVCHGGPYGIGVQAGERSANITKFLADDARNERAWDNSWSRLTTLARQSISDQQAAAFYLQTHWEERAGQFLPYPVWLIVPAPPDAGLEEPENQAIWQGIDAAAIESVAASRGEVAVIVDPTLVAGPGDLVEVERAFAALRNALNSTIPVVFVNSPGRMEHRVPENGVSKDGFQDRDPFQGALWIIPEWGDPQPPSAWRAVRVSVSNGYAGNIPPGMLVPIILRGLSVQDQTVTVSLSRELLESIGQFTADQLAEYAKQLFA